jgi:hypothetical protein
MDHIHNFMRQTGPSLSPFNAWVLLKGLETLAVRVRARPKPRRRRRRAGAHPKISRLIYPGRADHPQAATGEEADARRARRWSASRSRAARRRVPVSQRAEADRGSPTISATPRA